MAVLWTLIKNNLLENAATITKIRQWYWCGVFGEFYNNAANRGGYVSDVVEVMNWIYVGDIPKILNKLNLVPNVFFHVKVVPFIKALLRLSLKIIVKIS